MIIANTLAASGDCKTPPDSLTATAAHIIEQFDRQKDNLKTLVRQFAMSASAKVNRLKFKAVRDRFILELIR